MAIYQVEKSKRTKDGRSWYFRCYYTDLYGKRKQKQSKLFSTKAEAKLNEAEFLSSIIISDETDKNIMFETVYNEWLSYKKSSVKSTTYYSVVKRSEFHILPYFKKYKLHSIKYNTIDNWKNNLYNTKISLGHQNTLITTLKEILIYARDNYDYDYKIVSKIQKYKIETVVTKHDAETNFWTYEEFEIFIESVDVDYYNLVFNFLYFTGLRSGEMIALTWRDIDLENKTLRINKTFTNKVLDGTYKITTPKTTNSIRTIDIDDRLTKMLKKHRENEEKIYGFNEDMFIFGNAKYLAPTTLKRYLYKYIDKVNINKPENLKLKKITVHGFRHSHVSLLYDLGCDDREIADRVGDTIHVIQNTYYHMSPKKKSNTVNALNTLNLRGK